MTNEDFMVVFSKLAEGGKEVQEAQLFNELERSGKFTIETARAATEEAQKWGAIYETKIGVFMKA